MDNTSFRQLRSERLDYGGTPEFIVQIIETTRMGIWDWNLTDDHFAVNDVWAQILGYNAENTSGHIDFWRSHLHPDDIDIVNATVDEYIAGKLPEYDIEYRMLHRGGAVVWVQEKGALTEWDENGTPTRFIGTMQDISLHKETELKLENSRRLSQTLEESVRNASLQIRLTENMLRAQNEAASLLVAATHCNHDQTLKDSLFILGKAINVNRICIYKSYTDDGQHCCKLIYHNDIGGESGQSAPNLPNTYNFGSEIPSWKRKLMRGQSSISWTAVRKARKTSFLSASESFRC